MPSFMLRSIDPQLWQDFKAKAAQDGLTPKQAILAALAAYVQRTDAKA